jgi:methionine synthase I (cobalamin-dependent)
MHPLIQELIAAGPVLTDGAWGTELQARGLPVGEIPDGWNLSHPQRVADVAKAYVEAGSQIILTNTFGANRLRLAADDLADSIGEINRRGVEISREAATGGARVFASMGPSGKTLSSGEVTQQELLAAFEQQATALAAAGVEGFVVETMSELAEAVIAVEVVHGTGLPVVACMMFDCGKEKDLTISGCTPEEAAAELAAAGADVIGANCGQGVANFVPLCSRLHAASMLPIWIKANAGLPTIANNTIQYGTTPEEFASYIPALVKAGANFVGGCCGTRPDFIQAIRKVL